MPSPRPCRPLILCYHAVSSSWPSTLAIPPRTLRYHLDLLRRRGYVGLTFSESEARRREGALPSRSVVVTFDDGFRSVLAAEPLLEAAGFPATIFAVTSFVDSQEPLSWPGIEGWNDTRYAGELRPLGWRDLRRLAKKGWEIGSHTVSHPALPEVDDERLRGELQEARAAIEGRLGRCESLAYPYGRADGRTAAAAAAAGYRCACTLTADHRIDDPQRRPRVGLYPADRGVRARAKLSPRVQALRRTRGAGLASRLRAAGARGRRDRVMAGIGVH